MFQAHGARRMRLLLVAEDNARILVTTFFIILLLRAMGGSPIVLVFPVSQICDLTPSLCACRDDCQSGVWDRQYTPPGNTFAIYYLDTPGTYDIGWHQFCAIGYSGFLMGAPNSQNSVWIIDGPDSNGQLHWIAGIGYADNYMYANCF